MHPSFFYMYMPVRTEYTTHLPWHPILFVLNWGQKAKEGLNIMEYGLIGEKLGHSASKEIHEQLADYSYELHPLTKEDFSIFM